jgi:hypothetical protein
VFFSFNMAPKHRKQMRLCQTEKLLHSKGNQQSEETADRGWIHKELKKKKNTKKQGVVVHTYNPSTWETEASLRPSWVT